MDVCPITDVHLDESGCWVTSLLEMLLTVLLLNLQSKTGAKDPLRDRRADGQVS